MASGTWVWFGKDFKTVQIYPSAQCDLQSAKSECLVKKEGRLRAAAICADLSA